MHTTIHTILLTTGLIGGAVAIFISNRMMRQYQTPYLASYFYYLVFTFIFTVYSIAGSGILKILLSRHEITRDTLQTASTFLLVLGTPFLILSWYMFLRLTAEFFRKNLPTGFTITYFLVFLLVFGLYLFSNMNPLEEEPIPFRFTRKLVLILYTIFSAGIYSYACGMVFLRSNQVNDVNQRNAYRWFAGWYLLITALNLGLLFHTEKHLFLSDLFILTFSGFHLLPVLFLYLYLQNNYVAHVEDTGFSAKLQRLSDRYGITAREQEIITLICKGMTNQQISDSLFISLQTVKDHTHRIYLKTGVKNRVQLSNLLES